LEYGEADNLKGSFYDERGGRRRGKSAFRRPEAAAYALEQSYSRLSDLENKLEDRFKKLYGEHPRHIVNHAEIRISKEEIEEFEQALGPACAFVNQVRHAWEMKG
jgi:hypothetical protein